MVRVRATGRARARARVRVRVGLEHFLSVDLGIKLGLTVFVTSRRYRQTNSALALKETNRFTRLNADPCSYARVSRRDDYVSFDTTVF